MPQDGKDTKEGLAQAVPPETYLLKTKRCKFFLQGLCSKGAACGYAHTKSELKTRPDFYRTRMCPHLKDGGQCPDGAECRYAHRRNDLRRFAPLTKESGQAETSPCKIKIQGTEDSAGQDFANSSPEWTASQAKFCRQLSEAIFSLRNEQMLVASKSKIDICTQTDLSEVVAEHCQKSGRVTLSLESLSLPEEGKTASDLISPSPINSAGTQKVIQTSVAEAHETYNCTDTQKANQNPVAETREAYRLKLQFAKVSKLRSSAPMFQPGALPSFNQVQAGQPQPSTSMCHSWSDYEKWAGGVLQGWPDVPHCDDAGSDDCREPEFDSCPPTTASACQAMLDSTSQSESPNEQQNEEHAFQKAAADLTHWLLRKNLNNDGSFSPPSTTVCDENVKAAGSFSPSSTTDHDFCSSLEDHVCSNVTPGTDHNSPRNIETDQCLTLRECVAAYAPLAHSVDDLEAKARLQSLEHEPEQSFIFEDVLISV